MCSLNVLIELQKHTGVWKILYTSLFNWIGLHDLEWIFFNTIGDFVSDLRGAKVETNTKQIQLLVHVGY